MEENKVHKVVILGSGPAGLTAALYAARAQLSPIVLHGNQPGGQLTTTTEIENYPGFIKGIDGNELLENMQKQAERFGAVFKFGEVERVEFGSKPFKLHLKNEQKELITQTVIIATGARPRLLGLPSEKNYWAKGVTSCATCDGFFFKGQDVVVVGGGDSAAEESLFLTRMCSKVYLVHRRDALRASVVMANRVKENKLIHPVWDSVIEEVLGDDKAVTGIRVKNVKTGAVTDIPLKGVFIAIGHIPNTDIFAGILDRDENGYLKVQPHSAKSTIPGVFIAGDCADHTYRQAVTAAGTGCQAAIDAERYLAESGL